MIEQRNGLTLGWRCGILAAGEPGTLAATRKERMRRAGTSSWRGGDMSDVRIPEGKVATLPEITMAVSGEKIAFLPGPGAMRPRRRRWPWSAKGWRLRKRLLHDWPSGPHYVLYYLTCYLGQITFSADPNDALLFYSEQDAYLLLYELVNDHDVVVERAK